MQQEIDFALLREIDSHALNLITKDRTVYYLSKRVLDFILAALALIGLFPVMLLIAILIKLDTPGPVLFVQERVGVRRRNYNGITYWQQVIFRCYKFRTMVCNADPSLHKNYVKALICNDTDRMTALQGHNTQVRKLLHDPRVTRIGRVLRKSSLDEIPQFWNVIKSDLSLVGPRPAIPYEVEMYSSWHRRRLEGQPGITGLWQVTARSSADFDEIVKLDIQYIDNQSFWLDLKILAKTPLVVLFCKGAV